MMDNNEIGRDIKYLEHPVTPSEKKRWVEAGFKIIDIRFSPNYDPTKKANTALPPSKMKVGDLKDALDARSIGYNDEDKKPALTALLQEALDAE